MSRTQTPLPGPITVDTRSLIGLREGANPAEWGRIRATQLEAGRQLALLWMAANLVAGAITISVFAPIAPALHLAGWGTLLTVIAVTVAMRRLSVRPVEGAVASLRDIRDTALEGIALAAVWSIPPLFFAIGGSTPAYALLMILSVLMAAAAFAMAPLVLASLVFLAVVGLSLALALAIGTAWTAAAATLFLTGLLMTTCFARARALVAIRAAELALAERDGTVSLLLREFEDHAAHWLWETDAARRIVRPSARFASACGREATDIDGTPLLQLLAGPDWDSGDVAPALRTLANRLKARESFRDLRLPVQVDGAERWWDIAASPRFDERGAYLGFRGVGSDVTEQRASADKINRMARFDMLTGLPNRLLVNEKLAQAMAEADRWGGRCAFLMIDLDRFKAVNDTLGHPVGDRLLSRVSERLSQLMGTTATCGRLGGDEFAVVIGDVRDLDAAERVAHAIIETLSRPYELDQHTLHIGASVGLAIGPRDGRTAETLIRSADLALYRSKDKGGGVFHAYEPQLHAEAEERRILEMALRKALEHGEMHLAYQPVVDAGTGSPTGFEALLRWTHPDLGVVPPSRFIPLAEEARIIAPIGEWVLRTACTEAAGWPSEARIAVNVSADQLHSPGFVAVVASALASSGLSPERLELEVTESVFMREETGATRALERILDMGVRLSLDDFGTGFSSLGYLSRTRFSSIKIDRSFVQEAAAGGREATAIIRAVVALADSLGMATTAEGVETDIEHRMVQTLGCTKVQGYYFSRPLTVADARALIDQHWRGAADAA
ncbi:diguanylate cyclase [Sphingomonas sp. Leaf17]|uniref:putative bifunctional diguanylate cyclase/phosphodiesterase n=1 Tax=Sphingomonas sp. Leaf17 TaxID=1735683 RepID=UPI0006F86BAA|nr:EAL domain-containing protein [Sphingomonas sp. Leaf17]KQM67546.1 diguanylate cyclase [Sphingomonas sp. Leaf17]